MTIKTILFDFDGTIADSLFAFVNCMNKLAFEYGYEQIQDVTPLRDKEASQIFREDLGISLISLPGYIKKLKEILRLEMQNVSIFDGIKEVIEKLSKKYTLGILTSNSNEIVKEILEKKEIQCVDFIVSDSSIFGKDKVIKRVLDKYNLKKDEVIYIGDETRDLDACRKVDVKIACVTWGFNSREALIKKQPDFLIDKIEDFFELLTTI